MQLYYKFSNLNKSKFIKEFGVKLILFVRMNI